MDHFRILKRAFQTTINYRVLWIFGILVALASPNIPNDGSPGGGGGAENGGRDWGNDGFPFPPVSPELMNFGENLLTIAVVLICVFLLLGIAITILRYLSENALIQMVDRFEESGEKLTWREGFRLGWSRGALRLFLIDLIVGLGGAIVIILLLSIAALPLLGWLTENEVLQILGTMITVGLVLLIIFLAIMAGIGLAILQPFFKRAAVLDGTGVVEAFGRGWQIVRQRLGDVILMGLILFGLWLAFTVVMVPIFLMLVIAGAVIGGLPALLSAWIASLMTQGILPMVLAIIVGLPLFLLVIILPSLFIGGLAEVFSSSAWTLTYREARTLGTGQLQNDLAPELS